MVDTEFLIKLYKKWSVLDKFAKTIAHASFTESDAKSETEMLRDLVRVLLCNNAKQEDFIIFLQDLHMASP